MEIGKVIRELRESRRLTPGEFADVILISAKDLEDIESGRKAPQESELYLIANYFNLDLTELTKGNVIERASRDEILEEMQGIRKDVEVLHEDNKYLRAFMERIGLAQGITFGEQYRVERIETNPDVRMEEEYSYVIIDTSTQQHVKRTDGMTAVWEDIKDARKAAAELNKAARELAPGNIMTPEDLDRVLHKLKPVKPAQTHIKEMKLKESEAVTPDDYVNLPTERELKPEGPRK